MTRIGRWAAVGALVTGIVTVATWDLSRPATEPSAVAAPDGAVLFHSKGCASCHRGPDSESPMGVGYPSLAAVPSWAGDRREGMSAEQYLVESIAAPDAFISPAFSGGVGPGTSMPQLALTSAEIDALVAYLLAEPAGSTPTD